MMELYNPDINYSSAVHVSPKSAEELCSFLAAQGTKDHLIPVCNTGHGFHTSAASAKTVLDLSQLKAVARKDDHAITVGAGVRWKDVYASIPDCHRLVSGSFSGVGICGYLSGSGIGPDARIVGPSSNFVEALEVVDRQGIQRSCSRNQNSEIFEQALVAKGSQYIITSALLNTTLDREYKSAKVTVDARNLSQTQLSTTVLKWMELCSSHSNVASSIQILFVQGIPTLNFRAVALPENAPALASMIRLLELEADIEDLWGSQLSELHGEPEKSPGSFMDGFGLTRQCTAEDYRNLVDAAFSIGQSSSFFGFELRHCEFEERLLDDSLPSRVWKNVSFLVQHGSLSVDPVDANATLTRVVGDHQTQLLPNFSRELDDPDQISHYASNL